MRRWWWWEREREREREQEEERERERRKRLSFGEKEAEGALQGRRQQEEAQMLEEVEQGEWAVALEAAEDDAIQDAMPAQVRAAVAVCGACAARASGVTRPSLCVCVFGMRVHVPVCVCVRARVLLTAREMRGRLCCQQPRASPCRALLLRDTRTSSFSPGLLQACHADARCRQHRLAAQA